MVDVMACRVQVGKKGGSKLGVDRGKIKRGVYLICGGLKIEMG